MANPIPISSSQRKKDGYYYLGIDPGSSGGMVLLNRLGNVILTSAMPHNDYLLWEWMYGLTRKHLPIYAALERVGGFMGSNDEGGKGQRNKASAHTMFTFGAGYGALRMALVASQIPFTDVTPSVWQRALGITPKGRKETKTEFKQRIKARAHQLFPKIKLTLNLSDAIMLAEHARRKGEGVA